MNHAQLRTLIQERVLADTAVADAVAARDDTAVAAAINALGATRSRSRLTTSRGIYAALGLSDGAVVMGVLRALATGKVPGTDQSLPAGHPLLGYVPVFRDLVPWMDPPCDGLDFGAADLQGVISTLAGAGLFTNTQRDKLLALGREPDTVSVADVSAVLNEGI